MAARQATLTSIPSRASAILAGLEGSERGPQEGTQSPIISQDHLGMEEWQHNTAIMISDTGSMGWVRNLMQERNII